MKKIIIWAMATLCLVSFAVPVSAAITATTAEVTWSEVTSYNDGSLIPTGVDVGYILKWGTASKNYTELKNAGWDQLNYCMTNLVLGKLYYISARAYTSLNEESGDAPEHVYLHVGAPKLPIYRFLNGPIWAYQLVISEAEKNTISAPWKNEGPKFYAFATQAWGTVPVYCFKNPRTGSYFYTASETEKANTIKLLSSTWNYVGIKFYAFPTQVWGTVPVYRFLNAKTWGYQYTIDQAEKNTFMSNFSSTWKPEGVKFYVSATQMQ
jgi:hypothetical protein